MQHLPNELLTLICHNLIDLSSTSTKFYDLYIFLQLTHYKITGVLFGYDVDYLLLYRLAKRSIDTYRLKIVKYNNRLQSSHQLQNDLYVSTITKMYIPT